MKIYVAAAFQDYRRASNVATKLRERGCEITHDWMEEARKLQATNGELPSDATASEGDQLLAAERDRAGVRAADVLLLLTPDRKDWGCGCWVEFGIADGDPQTHIVVSGKLRDRTIFAKRWPRFETDDEAISHIVLSIVPLKSYGVDTPSICRSLPPMRHPAPRLEDEEMGYPKPAAPEKVR